MYLHCFSCRKVFSSSRGLSLHTSKNQCHRKHSMCSENHDHDWIKQEFPSLEAAKDWILAQELDQLFTAVTFRNGYGVYSCRHREKPETRAAKDQSISSEVKRNRSRLTPHGCKAGFKLRKVMRCSCVDFVAKTLCFHQEILFELRGCLTHSHPVERKSRRISHVTKNLLMSLLEAGVPKSVIRDKYCRPSDSDNSDAKFVTLQDLTNFENALKKTKVSTKSSTPDSYSQLDPTIASVSDETPTLPVKSIVLPFSIEVEPTSICLSGPDGKSTTDFNWLDLTDSELLDSTSTNDEDLTGKADTSMETPMNPDPECVPQLKKSDDAKPIIDFNWIELAASSKISKFDQAIPSPSMKPLTSQEFERKLSRVLVELGHRVRQADVNDQTELLGRLMEINDIAKNKMKLSKPKQNVKDISHGPRIIPL